MNSPACGCFRPTPFSQAGPKTELYGFSLRKSFKKAAKSVRKGVKSYSRFVQKTVKTVAPVALQVAGAYFTGGTSLLGASGGLAGLFGGSDAPGEGDVYGPPMPPMPSPPPTPPAKTAPKSNMTTYALIGGGVLLAVAAFRSK